MQHHPLHSGVGGSKQPKDNNNHDAFILKALQSAQFLQWVHKPQIKGAIKVSPSEVLLAL